jgi:hypothetical protein
MYFIQHNIITDLIKYLIDFSRDYYQQTFMWQTRQKPPLPPSYDQQIMNKTNSERLTKLKPILSTAEADKPRQKL